MKRLSFYVAAGLGMLGVLLWLCLRSLPDGRLHVFVLDIGQGDAILVQTPTGERMLIDGGPNDSIMKELGKVMPFYERTIDVVVLSHPHADHVDGLVEVLKRYRVGAVVMSGVKYNYTGYTAFVEEVAARHIPLVYAGAKFPAAGGGTADYRLGSVTLDMLFPFESEQGRSFENQNNGSVVFRLLYGDRSFYFSGDLEVEGEEKLVASGLDLRADFYKAGHHGSRTAGSVPLLDRVRPEYAAISCGVDNKFKHPHPITLEHFQERGMKIFRTDLEGMIEVVSDGKMLEVKGWGKV